MRIVWRLAGLAACLWVILATPAMAQTLKVVAHSDLKVLDPIWTTANTTRNHGYMVYDTLFAGDTSPIATGSNLRAPHLVCT